MAATLHRRRRHARPGRSIQEVGTGRGVAGAEAEGGGHLAVAHEHDMLRVGAVLDEVADERVDVGGRIFHLCSHFGLAHALRFARAEVDVGGGGLAAGEGAWRSERNAALETSRWLSLSGRVRKQLPIWCQRMRCQHWT
eukprot:537978-Rhodomonas_salina.2